MIRACLCAQLCTPVRAAVTDQLLSWHAAAQRCCISMFRVDLPVCEMPPLSPDITLLVSADLKCFWDSQYPAWGLVEVHTQTRHASEPKQEWGAALGQHIFLPDNSMNQQIKCICCWHRIQSKLEADTPKCLSNCLSQALTVPSEWCQVNDIGRGPRMSTLPAEVSAADLTEMTGNQIERCLWSCSADFLQEVWFSERGLWLSRWDGWDEMGIYRVNNMEEHGFA